MKSVRAGCVYRFVPVLGDARDYPEVKSGTMVRVVTLSCGRPGASMRHVETLDGRLIGLVYTASLESRYPQRSLSHAECHCENNSDYCDACLYKRGEL